MAALKSFKNLQRTLQTALAESCLYGFPKKENFSEKGLYREISLEIALGNQNFLVRVRSLVTCVNRPSNA